MISLNKPANAIIYSWEFTNENGEQGSNTDLIKGTVEFTNPVFNSSASAIDVRVTEVVTAIDLSFLSNGSDVELNQNILLTNPDGNTNNFTFNNLGEITNANFARFGTETLSLGGFGGFSFLNQSGLGNDTFSDSDSSTLVFSQQASASVPFEFSPTLGLLLMGGVWGVNYFSKSRKSLAK